MKNFFLFGIFIWLVLISGCEKADQEDMVIASNDIIRIEFETDTTKLTADGQTLISFKAVIPADSKEEYKIVTFTSTANLGTFQSTSTENKNIVKAGTDGFAYSSILVSNIPGIYFLSAEISSGDKSYRSKSYALKLVPVTQSKIISLEFESDTANLKADNQSLIKVKAKVTPSILGTPKSVVFIINEALGTFQGTGGDPRNTVSVNNDGIARATIKSGSIPGKYFVSAQISEGTQVFKTSDYAVTLLPAFAAELKISVNDSLPAADGFTLLTIMAETKFSTEKQVELTSNFGTFIQSSDPSRIVMQIDHLGKGSVIFKISNEIKQHVIVATHKVAPSTSLVISPHPSWPEVLLLETNTLSVDTLGGSIQLMAFLRKSNAEIMVSKNMLVQYMAYQIKNNFRTSVGRFTGINNAVSGVEGNVPTVSFYADAGNVDPKIPVFIEVSTAKNETEFLTKILEVKIKE
jgi:hypothetical protein